VVDDGVVFVITELNRTVLDVLAKADAFTVGGTVGIVSTEQVRALSVKCG